MSDVETCPHWLNAWDFCHLPLGHEGAHESDNIRWEWLGLDDE